VIATGVTTSIRDFIRHAFAEAGVEIDFRQEGINEKGTVVSINESVFKAKVGEEYLENFMKRINDQVVGVDPAYFRPTEVDLLIGDATKSRQKLGWNPEYSLTGLIEDMVSSDLNLMKKESFLKSSGYKILNYFE
jgi:GDPmannose 4,6-dehydratase